ncbi:MAG TPA: DUF2937 family protein [Opitutaceae bacterium]|nr:DUF2937 family protein [Opitutaceae bacterium]
MNPVRRLLGAAEGLLDRALCVAGAVILSQAPEFMQQYLQRLGGHLDEARLQLRQFQQAAEQSGLTLDRLITQTNANADPAVARLGGVMADAVARTDALAAAEAAIAHASLWARPFVFLRHLDPAIARATWGVFKPAVPTTAEGLVYAVLGMIVLLALYHGGVKYPVACWRRARARRRQVPAAA